MVERDRNQLTLTLSEKAMEEFRIVAEWSKMPLATLLRQILEQHHQSPAFGALLERARQELDRSEDEDEDEDDE